MSDVKQAASEPVSSALTLVMELASDEAAAKLQAFLAKNESAAPGENRITQAMDKLGLVHDARFVFLGSGRFAVITTYDGTFDAYLDLFITEIGDLFDFILSCMKDSPPLPVSANPEKFREYVRKHDLTLNKPFYSAYPDLTVRDILTLRDGGA